MSLVRLVYAMAVKRPSPVLSLMSAWMVLGVGLIDGLIYVSVFWLRALVSTRARVHYYTPVRKRRHSPPGKWSSKVSCRTILAL